MNLMPGSDDAAATGGPVAVRTARRPGAQRAGMQRERGMNLALRVCERAATGGPVAVRGLSLARLLSNAAFIRLLP